MYLDEAARCGARSLLDSVYDRSSTPVFVLDLSIFFNYVGLVGWFIFLFYVMMYDVDDYHKRQSIQQQYCSSVHSNQRNSDSVVKRDLTALSRNVTGLIKRL